MDVILCRYYSYVDPNFLSKIFFFGGGGDGFEGGRSYNFLRICNAFLDYRKAELEEHLPCNENRAKAA